MANRGTRKGYSGQKPQGNGYYRGAGGRPVDNERRRKRRRKRIMKALIAWAVCILLVGLIAVGDGQGGFVRGLLKEKAVPPGRD